MSNHYHHHGNGPRRRLLRKLVGHGHDPSERVDKALETSAQGIRTLKFSLLALGITAILQLLVVAMTGSVALLGDTPCTTSPMRSRRFRCGSRSTSGVDRRRAATPTATASPRTSRAVHRAGHHSLGTVRRV